MTERSTESVWGWARLALSLVAYALVPVWFLGAVLAGQMYPELRDLPVGIGLVVSLAYSAALVVPCAVVLAVGLWCGTRVWRRVARWRTARVSGRYDAIIGDGGVMRPDAWDEAPRVED